MHSHWWGMLDSNSWSQGGAATQTSTRRPGIEGSGSRPSPAAAASTRNHALGVRPAARLRDNFVGVTFAMMVTEFAEASQVIKIITGEIEPP
jgi:hypothetical protein